MTPFTRQDFVARLRWDFPEAHPVAWGWEAGPKVFINPIALPSFLHKRADRLAARIKAEMLAEEYARLRAQSALGHAWRGRPAGHLPVRAWPEIEGRLCIHHYTPWAFGCRA